MHAHILKNANLGKYMIMEPMHACTVCWYNIHNMHICMLLHYRYDDLFRLLPAHNFMGTEIELDSGTVHPLYLECICVLMLELNDLTLQLLSVHMHR